MRVFGAPSTLFIQCTSHTNNHLLGGKYIISQTGVQPTMSRPFRVLEGGKMLCIMSEWIDTIKSVIRLVKPSSWYYELQDSAQITRCSVICMRPHRGPVEVVVWFRQPI